jgi:catechol 2,3-dioxygenase-like lactoylglutathione lyase family enzyme
MRDALTTGRPRTSGGQSHSSEIPTIWSASPMSAMISVALGRSEQIRMPATVDEEEADARPRCAERPRPRDQQGAVTMTEYHVGRMIDHVHLRVADLEASKRFYRAALEAVGLAFSMESESAFSADELFVSDDGEPTSGLHLAFQAADRETVDRFYEAALAAGGRDNGRPGLRDYHPGYYSAYVLDPDGNNIEAVFHGPARRSADSVVLTPEN